jgi:hypothetical protein
MALLRDPQFAVAVTTEAGDMSAVVTVAVAREHTSSPQPTPAPSVTPAPTPVPSPAPFAPTMTPASPSAPPSPNPTSPTMAPSAADTVRLYAYVNFASYKAYVGASDDALLMNSIATVLNVDVSSFQNFMVNAENYTSGEITEYTWTAFFYLSGSLSAVQEPNMAAWAKEVKTALASSAYSLQLSSDLGSTCVVIVADAYPLANSRESDTASPTVSAAVL